MRIRNLRFATIVGILVACGFALAKGWDIVRFRFAEGRIASTEHPVDAMSSWASVRGLASYTIEPLLVLPIDQNDKQAVTTRLNLLTALLSVKPLSSDHWLSLSAMRLLNGQQPEKVIGALSMSVLTGPHEGHVLVERILFCFSIWELLPMEMQQRAAGDFSALTEFSDADKVKLQALMSSTSARVRISIRNLLLEQGALSEENLSKLGF